MGPPSPSTPHSPDNLIRWIVSPDEENLRLDQLIAVRVEIATRSRAKRWIEAGLVRVEGRTVRPSRMLHAGETVEVELPPVQPAAPEPEAIPLEIIYEDDDLLVLVKPPGMVVHPAAGHSSGTLVNALLHHCRKLSGIGGVARPGIVHRLDRGTSGLLVVAKNDLAHGALSRQFATRSVEKRYLALVHGVPPEQLRLEDPIGRDLHNRKRMSTRTHRGKQAITTVDRIETFRLCSLVSVRIQTGRTHQIRVHLSEAQFPVVGDSDYGRRRQPPKGEESAFRILSRVSRPALHASMLSFRHPRTGQPMRFEIPLSPDIQRAVDELRTLADDPRAQKS